MIAKHEQLVKYEFLNGRTSEEADPLAEVQPVHLDDRASEGAPREILDPYKPYGLDEDGHGTSTEGPQYCRHVCGVAACVYGSCILLYLFLSLYLSLFLYLLLYILMCVPVLVRLR